MKWVYFLSAFLVCATAGILAGAPPDFEAAHRETVTNLQRFVQIDTSNPPGNETKGAQFLKAILDREGIPSEIVERVPGRAIDRAA